MLYYQFKNYEEFKELFAIQHHGNGEKSRRNKILLAYIKNPLLLHNATTSGDYSLLHISSMAELKQKVTVQIRDSSINDDNLPHELNVMGDIYRSSFCYTDDYKGVCEDGDNRSFRYVSSENNRVFKMKMGKFYRKIILATSFGMTLPEQVITYLCEEMSQEWQTYTMGYMPKNKLFVNKEFRRIYDSGNLKGDFHSCMVNKNYHAFYEDAVDASAAYLENDDGMIIARCIIFNKVKDQNEKIWRLAERQYSTDGNDILKRVLVDALIQGGHIDGYKIVGAGCGECHAFVDNEGNSLSSFEFYIDCNLDWGDILSFQDSFKYYDTLTRIATNFGKGDLSLDVTEGELESDDGEYDDYHECYCSNVTCVMYHGREIYCDSDRLDDFVWIESEDFYYHEDDVYSCDECGEYYVSENGCHSEITEESYCCSSCLEMADEKYKEDNWTHSEYDDAYFENSDDVTEYQRWQPYSGRYEICTISEETLSLKLDDGDFYCIDGISYDAIDEETGLPFAEKISANESLIDAA